MIRALLILCIACNSMAGTYYVSTTGSDAYNTTQAQNPATPWLTIANAVSFVSAGDLVLVDDGTYTEGATLSFSKRFSSRMIIASKNNNPTNVIITASGSSQVMNFTGSEVVFSNVTFQSSNTSQRGMNVSGGGLVLNGCLIYTYGDGCDLYAGMTNFCATNCVMVSTNSGAFGGSQLISNVFCISCTFTGRSDTVSFIRGYNLNFFDCSITSATAHGMYFGVDGPFDGSNAGLLSANVSNCIVRCNDPTTVGHGLIFGANCSNCTVTASTIVSTKWGLVIKACYGVVAVGNTITNGPGANSSSCIYFKESLAGCTASNNTCYVYPSTYGIESNSGDTGNGFTNVTCVFNRVFCPDSTTLAVEWNANGISAKDLGGSTIDYNNYYFPAGSMQVGQKDAGTIATDITSWRSNWAGYSVANNESHSFAGTYIMPSVLTAGTIRSP